MSNDTEELRKMRQSLDRLVSAIENSSMVGSGIKVRTGRGGNSNRSTADNSIDRIATDYAKLNKSTKEMHTVIRNASRTSELWVDSLNRMTGAQKIMGERISQTISRIDKANREQTEATRRITEKTLELVKLKGLESAAIKRANADTFLFAKTMAKLQGKQEERKRIENINNEIKELKDIRAEAMKVKPKQRDNELIKAVEAEIKNLREMEKTLPEVNEEIERLSREAITLREGLRGVSPALDEVADSSLALVDVNGKQELAAENVADVMGSLGKHLDAQVNAYDHLNKEVENLAKGIHSARDSIVSGVKDMTKKMGGIIGVAIDNFREQLKFNIRESHYIQAARMGMSDGELSRFLGENVDTFRGVTGSADNAKILDGTLQDLTRRVTEIYGETGMDAARRVAQVASTMQQSGISNMNSPALIEARLKNFSDMADRVGMVKGELVDFAQQLAESGDMAFLASKYEGLSEDKKMAALDAELEARIANAKMLGQSTDQIKEQIQLQRNRRYGGLGDQIRKMVGTKMLQRQMEKAGMEVTPEWIAARNKSDMGGVLNAQEQAILSGASEKYMSIVEGKRIAATDKYSKTGSFGDLAEITVVRGIMDGFGVEEADPERLALRDKQIADARKKYGDAAVDAFIANGTIADVLRRDNPERGANVSNSHALVADQTLNIGKTIYEGAMKNPLASLLGVATGILGSTSITAYNTTKISTLLGGGAGGVGRGAGGLATGKAARTAAGVGKNFKLAAASKWLKGGAALSAVFGGIEGYQESIAKGETTGNAISTGVGGAAGGGLGAWGGAAAGAAIGTAIVPVIGTAIGGIIGGIAGGMAGTEIGKKAGDVIHDTITNPENTKMLHGAILGNVIMPGIGPLVFGSVGKLLDNFGLSKNTSPEKILEQTRTQAEKVRSESASPLQVDIVGPVAGAIMASSAHTQQLADTSKEQLGEQKKAFEHTKSKDDIRAIFAQKRASIDAIAQKYADIENA